MLTDTIPEVDAIQLQLLRRTPIWRKLELMTGLTDMTRAAALGSLRQQFPQATEKELQRMLADRLLGQELAAVAYGPFPKSKELADAI
jgi:hypothetical protein